MLTLQSHLTSLFYNFAYAARLFEVPRGVRKLLS